MKGMFRSSAMFWTNENFEKDFTSQVGFSSLKTKQINLPNYEYKHGMFPMLIICVKCLCQQVSSILILVHGILLL